MKTTLIASALIAASAFAANAAFAEGLAEYNQTPAVVSQRSRAKWAPKPWWPPSTPPMWTASPRCCPR
jgi:hypothetical protein